MIDFKVIGNRIREKRLEQHMTQESVAEALSVSPEYMSKIENGKVQVNLKRLAQLSLQLKCPIEYFLSGTVEQSVDYKTSEMAKLMKACSPEEKDTIYKIAKLIVDMKK